MRLKRGAGRVCLPSAPRGGYGALVRLEVAARTDTGRVRQHNEDALLVRPGRRLFAVADGMGGHVAGEVASALAIATLDETFDADGAGTDDTDALARNLVDAALRANERILERGRRDPATRGMGTTLTAVAFPADSYLECALAHVGDSRAYRYRRGRLELLTRDHTWVQEEVEAGRLDPSEAKRHPYANVLSRVLGLPELDGIEARTIRLEPRDLLLLCTDGLTTMLDEEDITDVLAGDDDLDGCAAALIDAANTHGGNDNVSVVLLRPLPDDARSGRGT